jgi:hypothetical protein
MDNFERSRALHLRSNVFVVTTSVLFLDIVTASENTQVLKERGYVL